MLIVGSWPAGSYNSCDDTIAPFTYGPLQVSQAPIRACLHYWVGHRANSIINMAALNLCHVMRVLNAFNQFCDVIEQRWLVCNNYENSNLKKFFYVFVNSRRHNLADQLSPHCVVIIVFLYGPTRKVYDVRKFRWHN